jgi:hypothetical protein
VHLTAKEAILESVQMLQFKAGKRNSAFNSARTKAKTNDEICFTFH